MYETMNDIKGKNNYRDLLPVIMASQNGSIQRGTKCTPNEVRLMSHCPTLLDLELKLAGINKIKQDDYIKENVVDFKEYKKLIKKHLKTVHYMAQKQKLSNTLSKIHKNDIQDLENEKINKNDYVILKSKYTGKHDVNYHYGWVVIKLLQTENQLKPNYLIRNIFTGEEKTVNKGRLSRFHKPLINPALSWRNK